MCKAIEIYGEERKLEGRAEGRVEGRAEGAIETKIENARKMIADNLPVEKVAEYSGLPLAKVKELAGAKTA